MLILCGKDTAHWVTLEAQFIKLFFTHYPPTHPPSCTHTHAQQHVCILLISIKKDKLWIYSVLNFIQTSADTLLIKQVFAVHCYLGDLRRIELCCLLLGWCYFTLEINKNLMVTLFLALNWKVLLLFISRVIPHFHGDIICLQPTCRNKKPSALTRWRPNKSTIIIIIQRDALFCPVLQNIMTSAMN